MIKQLTKSSNTILKKENKKKLILIDTNALIHRSFHALPAFRTKDGHPSGAVYGVALTLISVIERFKPDYLIAAFDLKKPTFRHKKFKQYKANRKKAPDELYQQFPMIKEMIEAFKIPIYEKAGFEADDIIGTLAKDRRLPSNLERIIVTGDMDTLQLVDDNIRVYTMRKGIKDTVIYDEEAVKEKCELRPDQIVDYKALRGDPSDNIPGITGIGEKTAIKLLKEYQTLGNIYQNLDKINPKSVRKKISEGKEIAFLSQELATIKTNVELEFELEKMQLKDDYTESLASFFQKVGFRSLLKKINPNAKKVGPHQATRKIAVDIIQNKEESQALLKKAKKNREFSFSFLTDYINQDKSQLLGMGVSFDGNKGYFLKKEYLKQWKSIFNEAKIKKTTFDAKSAIKLLAGEFYTKKETSTKNLLWEKAENIFDSEGWLDIQILGYLLGSNVKTLERLILTELDEELSLEEKRGQQSSLLELTNDSQFRLAAEKACLIQDLSKELFRKLKASASQKEANFSLEKLFYSLEMPLVPILAKMELVGIKVNQKTLRQLADLVENKIKLLEKQIYQLSKEEFNIASPVQLSKILFDKLKIPTAGIKRGKSFFSTDAEQLNKLKFKHEIIPLVERFREYSKLKNTYIDSLPTLVQADGKIHTNFNQAVTITGRLSSSEPNLQNIPKRGEFATKIRQAFVAGKENCFLSVDYSQIDLRVAAHLSKDEKMIDIFRQNRDIHQATADWVNKIQKDGNDNFERYQAKALNFGILYGMGTHGFMRDSGLSFEKAQFFIESYKKTFSGLSNYLEQVKEQTRKNNFIETEMGRRRYIYDINSTNHRLRAAAERTAINFPIQGLAADIMKLAMLRAGKLLQEFNQKNKRISMLLQIHDELIFELKKEAVANFSYKITEAMESVYQLDVPLKVNCKEGKNWSEL